MLTGLQCRQLKLHHRPLPAKVGAVVCSRTWVCHGRMDRIAPATSFSEQAWVLNTSANALTWVCWKITLLGNSHCFGFWYSTQDIPRVLGQCWLPQSRRRQRSHTCFQALPWLQAGDSAASPRAVAATSLLNYINRPPSSVIFYFLGKKKMGSSGKKCVFCLSEHQQERQPQKQPRNISVEHVGKFSVRLKSLKFGVFFWGSGSQLQKAQGKYHKSCAEFSFKINVNISVSVTEMLWYICVSIPLMGNIFSSRMYISVIQGDNRGCPSRQQSQCTGIASLRLKTERW